MLSSSASFLNKMMETMIMQMLNNQGKDCNLACNNQTCNDKLHKKLRKRRKHHRHCKKSRSKCPTDDGVASILCVTKCIKKCKKSRNTTNRPSPCSGARKRKRNVKRKRTRKTSCSSNYSSSDANYCSKCGQPLPGSTLLHSKSPNGTNCYQETRSKRYATGISSPEETCISSHTQITCSSCQNTESIKHPQDILGQCDFFGSPYFLGNLNRPTAEDLCDGYSKNNIRLGGAEKQEYLFPVTCKDNKNFNTFSTDKSYAPPPIARKKNCSAAVRIKRCGKNIVTIRCGENGDSDLSHENADNNVRQYDCRGKISRCHGGDDHFEESQCSRRFIQITENQRSHYGENCITNVRCADYSSITSAPKLTSNKSFIADVQAESPCSSRTLRNTDIGPCSDRVASAVHPSSNVGHNAKSHVVRMKFFNPCRPVDMPCHDVPDYESDCDVGPSCTCYCENVTRPPVPPFCYDPTTEYYDDESCDVPCNCIDEPPITYDAPNTPLYSQSPPPNRPLYPQSPPPNRPLYPLSPPPVYHEPHEYHPVQRLPSESSASSSPSDESLPPKDHYGYDFFYGTIRPSATSDDKSERHRK